MADVLNQDEVDALLAAIDKNDDAPSKEDGAGGVTLFSNRRRRDPNVEIKNYDFKRPERVGKEQMRALENLHESFGRGFGAQLSGFLRTIVEVKVSNIGQITYSEYINSLPNPTSFNLLSCSPLDGQICMEISPLIIYPIMDRLLGGSNADLFIPQRPMTMIEQRLVGKITGRAVQALSEAWGSIAKIQFSVGDMESNPQLVQIVPPNEVVVVVGFEVKMGGRAGTMSLCVPFNVIEPLMDKLLSQTWQAYGKGKVDDSVRQSIANQLSSASVHATVILAQTTITVNDLLNMAPGDIIVTDKPATSPAVVSINGRKKFIGNVGQFKGKRAIKVSRLFNIKDRL